MTNATKRNLARTVELPAIESDEVLLREYLARGTSELARDAWDPCAVTAELEAIQDTLAI